MSSRRRLKPLLKVFDDLGIEVVDTTITGSKHFKITVTDQGNTHFFIAPYSSSDYRSMKNFYAIVKRWHRDQHKEM